MKSFISVLMALVMAFACIGCVSAEEQRAVTVEITASLDKEALSAMPGMTEESKQQIEFFSDILNVLKLNAVIDGQAIQMDVMAEDDKLFTLAGRKDNKGITVASSLLGNNVIQIVPEKMAQLMQSAGGTGMPQISGSFDIQKIIEIAKSLDMKKVSADMLECVQDFIGKFQAKVGEPETGSFEVDGQTFTMKVPINMTVDELLEMGVSFFKGIVTKESVAPLMKALAGDKDIGAAIDKWFEEAKKTPEDQKPDMEMAVYANESGDSYFVVDITGKKQEGSQQEIMHSGSGKIGGTTIYIVKYAAKDGGSFDMNMTATEDKNVNMTFKLESAQMNMDVEMHAEPGFADSVAVVKAGGMEVKTHSHTTVNDNGTDFILEYFFNAAEKAAITVNVKAFKGGEITAKFEGDDLQVIPFEKLMDKEDSSAVSQLAMEAMGQLTGALTTLKNHLPENTGNILVSLFTQGK